MLIREGDDWNEIAKSRTGTINAAIPLARFGGGAELRIEH